MAEALPRVDDGEPTLRGKRPTLRGKRDRALLVGFAGALRRSELVAVEADPSDSRASPERSQRRRDEGGTPYFFLNAVLKWAGCA
jgi:hypothetical protein